MKRLIELFDQLDSKPFGAIQQLKGEYGTAPFSLKFLRIQGSPGAHPASIAELSFHPAGTGFKKSHFNSLEAQTALSDFLIRRFHDGIIRFARQNRGADGSGSFHTIELTQKILKRDSVYVSADKILIRFIVSFPSKSRGGGSFDGSQAKIMFQQELAEIIQYTCNYSSYTKETKQALETHIRVIEDRKIIELFLERNHCITFVPDNALLPRKSGTDDRPMQEAKTNLFSPPDSLSVTLPLSENRSIRGMALKEGVIIITGGGFHGKSTLLQAIEAGIYPHVPGDGRERIVTRTDAVSIRAEEGRNVENLDISPFIRDLPAGISTRAFSTQNASGSTSQAAAIIEALEAGSRLLLFDEDTCATNLLVRDPLIRKIIPDNQEPIKPLYNVVRSLWKQHGISSLLVIGGLGVFLQKADTVLVLESYKCKDATALVREKLGPPEEEEKADFRIPRPRVLAKDNFDPSYINKRLNKTIQCRIKPLRNEPGKLEYGQDLIDLSAVPHIAEAPQTMTIGLLILELRRYLTQETVDDASIAALINRVYDRIKEQGLFCLNHDYPGTLSFPRKYELAAAVNRMRSLKIN